MESDKCELCGTIEKLQRHHLVPRSVLRALQPKPPEWFTNPTIIVCANCHKKIHESFLDHLRLSGKVDGLEDLDAFAAIKYQLIKRFLKEKHPGMYKEWRIFLDEFTESVFTEMEREE